MEILIIAFVVALIAFIIWINVRILNKAGYSGWWSLILFVPIVSIIMVYVFAFSQWPRLGQKNST